MQKVTADIELADEDIEKLQYFFAWKRKDGKATEENICLWMNDLIMWALSDLHERYEEENIIKLESEDVV